MSNYLFKELLEEFEQSLVDCRQLYLTSGRECVTNFPHLIRKSHKDFLEWMDDLHKGLLIKIYCEMALVDRKWSSKEQILARSLFLHVWSRDLSGEDLKEAMRGLTQQSTQIKWFGLVRPFVEIAPLRDHVGELETIVIRLANLIAKADGVLADSEARMLRSIQQQIDSHLKKISIDEKSNAEQRRDRSKHAVQTLGDEVEEIRDQCDLNDQHQKVEEKSSEERLQEALCELNSLIGLQSVKNEVNTLTNFLHVQKQREAAGLPRTELSLHMVFGGNPGTGKTTVARIVGKIFGAMGIVKSGHLIETDRSGLVAEYAGQTGPKTNAKIDEAIDGILFIDEAYSLVSNESDDAFGREALQTLLKRMEDDRDRLIVILAGYPKPMDTLLKQNPGLSSRFSRTLTFEDYQAPELGRIFERLCLVNHYRLTPEVRSRLLLGFDFLYNHRDEHFGNGRMVRNTFEDAIRKLSNRIAAIAPITKELLTKLESADIEFEVPNTIWKSATDIRFVVACPGCEKEFRVRYEFLGKSARCKNCDATFSVDWAKPLLDKG